MYRSKKMVFFLITIILVNFLAIGLVGNHSVEAGFFDDPKTSIITIIKGLAMLWIINLMRENASGGGSDDLITSTIKKGLNLDNQDENKADPADNKPEFVVETTDNTTGLTIREDKMLELLNKVRLEHGLKSLQSDPQLVKVAREKARDMIKNNYFAHHSPVYGSPFDMLKEEGVDYALAGENLAGAQTVEAAFSSLMNSPEHKDNILKARYDRVGVAVVEGGPYGLMIVQLFIDSPAPAL
ncbi:MAG: CAP domain-containing protein [Halanaerobiales bacterium]|nr:CAP domain-containing protein [Halanaerobiales bacterium]